MIRITRGKWKDGMMRKYKIYIDGVYRGGIRRGKTEEFIVDNGNHSIYGTLDICSSNIHNVDINNSVVELEIGPSSEGRSNYAIYYMIFERDNYLWIREKDNK